MTADQRRQHMIDRLVDDFVDLLTNDRSIRYDVGRAGFEGFEQRTLEQLERDYRDAFDEEPPEVTP